MAFMNFSPKRIQINRANATMIGVIAAASFVVIFSLIACKALLSQRAYQSKVIEKKQDAKRQLEENIKAANTLTTAYQEFIGSAENILKGSSSGSGDRDGDNARIILDALPSKYDFPALATSLEKILSDKAYTIQSIGGTDDELSQKSNVATPTPIPLEIPFQINISGSYPAMQNVISVFERSIRPIQIQSLELSGNDSLMRLSLSAKTFYQPEKSLNITTEVVQ
jgi:Tfp pilus assembly protein PilO